MTLKLLLQNTQHVRLNLQQWLRQLQRLMQLRLLQQLDQAPLHLRLPF